MSEQHAPSRFEHALCGLAPDAFDSGDWHEPILFAEPGGLVTCKECRAVLDHVRETFARYRVKSR